MGGNCLNASIVLARLGTKAYIATKIAKDYLGNMILDNFKKDGVDTRFISQKENSTSPFSYIIVDMETKTRTIVFNPCEELLSGELKEECLEGIKLLVLDGKQTAAAKEIGMKALDRGIPSLLDAEDPLISQPGFSDVVELSEYIKCGENFATKFTHIKEPLQAMEHLLKTQRARKEKKFVITTLGALGSVLMKREDEQHTPVASISTLAELKEKVGDLKPTHLPMSRSFKYEPSDFKCPATILIYSTSFPISPSDIKDTTGTF